MMYGRFGILCLTISLLVCNKGLIDNRVIRAQDGRPYAVIDSGGYALYKADEIGEHFVVARGMWKEPDPQQAKENVLVTAETNFYQALTKLILDICSGCTDSFNVAFECVKRNVSKDALKAAYFSDGTIEVSDTLTQAHIAGVVDCIRSKQDGPVSPLRMPP